MVQQEKPPPASPPAVHDPVGETYILEHAYKLVRRVATSSFFSTFEARQRPFDRPVYLRLYHKIDELGLSEKASERLRARLEAGGDGGLVSDFGEVPTGAPFVVLRPPHGKLLAEWWTRSPKDARTLSQLGLTLIDALETLSEAQRAEVTAERIHVVEEKGCPLAVDVYCIGDHPTRAEVREMSRLVGRDLVLGFPPECFLPQFVGQDGVEHLETADVYRVAAILYQLQMGEHPLFPHLADVSDAVANLINNLGRGLRPMKTGATRLDEVVLKALQTDPSQRPSLTTFRDTLHEELESDKEPVVEPVPPSLDKPRSRTRAVGIPRTLRWFLVFLLLVAAVLGTFLWTTRPPRRASILITSDPPGVTFRRLRLDGRAEELGQTPLLLVDEDLASTIQLQPVYQDGEAGQVVRVTPERLQLLDACRSLHVEFQPEAPQH